MQIERNVENDTSIPDTQAHAEAMSLPINTVVARLIALLGATTVAVIGGVTETRAVTQWTDGRSPQRPNVLRFALQIAMMIGGETHSEMVRAWFAGSNPHLEDQVPMLMLRDKPLNEISGSIVAAARAFAAR
ncbi:MAG: hypothetical protein JO322_13415 [Candidatus Eremiobacteraeota bacterium]|nr:hypothetical protein [Candidatus Eremiobacteraeota bacterium]